MIQDIEFTQRYKWYLSLRLFFEKLGMFIINANIINAEFLLENFKNVNLKINVIYNNVYQNP